MVNYRIPRYYFYENPVNKFSLNENWDLFAQILGDLEILTADGRVKRRPTLVVLCVHVGAVLHEEAHHRGIAVDDGLMKRSDAVDVGEIDVGAFGEQRLHLVLVAAHTGAKEHVAVLQILYFLKSHGGYLVNFPSLFKSVSKGREF